MSALDSGPLHCTALRASAGRQLVTFGLPQGIAHRSRQMTARAPHTHFIRLDLWNMCFRLFNDQGLYGYSSKIYLTLQG